jgi:hypothetical protein
MTLHAFDLLTNRSLRWVAVPLEFVDWMAAHFDGKLIQHLRQIDPYEIVRIPDSVLVTSIEEFAEVRRQLKKVRHSDVPKVVDLYGDYGSAGALMTVSQLLDFFEFTNQNECKVVSVGD